MSYMPVSQEHNIKCNYVDCAAGMGLAGNGRCFLCGEWDNADCPKFKSNEDFIAEHEAAIQQGENDETDY